MSARHYQRHINQCRIEAAARYPVGSKSSGSIGTQVLIALVLFISLAAILAGSR